MITTLTLFALFTQTPAVTEALPPVGSEAAIVAQNEFRSWLGSGAKAPTMPVHLEYEVAASLGLVDPIDSVEATFEGTMVSEVQSFTRMYHNLKGVALLKGEKQVPVEITLVLDGESFWFSIQTPGLHVLPEEGIYLTGKLSKLQEVYRSGVDFQKWGADRRKLQEGTPEVGLGDALTAFMQSLPQELGALMHPTGTLFYGMAPFTCREFSMEGGVVTASMGLDTQPEAFVVELLAQWHQMWAGIFGDSDQEDRTSKAYRILGDHVEFALGFDQETFTPDSLSIDFSIDAETLGLGSKEESMSFSAEVQRQATAPNADRASLIAAPHPERTAMEVTAFLEIALSEMRAEKEKIESAADEDF